MLYTFLVLVYFICGFAALGIFEKMEAIEPTLENLAIQTILILFWPISAVLGIYYNLRD